MSAPTTTTRAVLVGVTEDDRGAIVTLRVKRDDLERLLADGAWGQAVTVTHPAPVETCAPVDRGPRG